MKENKMRNKQLYNPYKLLKHLDRLSAWEKGESVPPISIDFDLTNRCNNKCPLCCTLKKDDTTVDFDVAKKVILQLKEGGLRAITFAGGGEPSCHPNLEELIKFAKENSIDVAIDTNAYKLSKGVIDAIINCCIWVRISLDANNAKMYKETHGMDEEAFSAVVHNIHELVNTKNKLKSNITIGLSYLIGSRTIKGIYNATKLAKNLGVDNIRFRPFARKEGMKKFIEEEIKNMTSELRKSKELENEQFIVSYPEDRCESMIQERIQNYKECYVPNFITTLSADLKLYSCCRLKYIEKHCIGNLKEKNFKEIWFSEKRIKVHERINLKKDCPNPCMYEKHNELLHLIKQPTFHPNFL